MTASRNILVTGVSRGVGLAIVRTLLKSGDTVYGVSRSSGEALAELRKEYPGRLHWKAVDLENTDAISQTIFDDFLNLDVPLHGFVNNAALAYDDIVTNLQVTPLERMFRVNVYSPMMLVKSAIRNMLFHRTEGSLVHISSISVHTGYKGLAMYAASKGALEAFSKNTAREWGERGIRSNCVVAGFMDTDMSSGLSDEQRQRIYRRTALKRATSLESVAETVAFLLSENSASVTGQNLFVDNGTL